MSSLLLFALTHHVHTHALIIVYLLATYRSGCHVLPGRVNLHTFIVEEEQQQRGFKMFSDNGTKHVVATTIEKQKFYTRASLILKGRNEIA